MTYSEFEMKSVTFVATRRRIFMISRKIYVVMENIRYLIVHVWAVQQHIPVFRDRTYQWNISLIMFDITSNCTYIPIWKCHYACTWCDIVMSLINLHPSSALLWSVKIMWSRNRVKRYQNRFKFERSYFSIARQVRQLYEITEEQNSVERESSICCFRPFSPL